MFASHAEVDAPGHGLRVSRYFDPETGPPHTRLSVYDGEGKVTSVVALDDATTARLARFLLGLGDARNEPVTRRRVFELLTRRSP
jgi:hypothetical protein